MPEVELHAGIEAPFQRHLVDGDGALAAVHGGGEMPGRIEMRGVMRGQPDPFDRPAFRSGQVALLQAGKEFHHVGRGLPMILIFDLRAVAGRIGGDIVFERNRNVDELAGHMHSPDFISAWSRMTRALHRRRNRHASSAGDLRHPGLPFPFSILLKRRMERWRAPGGWPMTLFKAPWASPLGCRPMTPFSVSQADTPRAWRQTRAPETARGRALSGAPSRRP